MYLIALGSIYYTTFHVKKLFGHNGLGAKITEYSKMFFLIMLIKLIIYAFII